ncbi:MAG: hypothetical protein ABIQ04_03210 [Candidatus Saccharimonadales bacterium]
MISPEVPVQKTEEVFSKGKLFELIHETQPDGRVFEKARRAPGVRLIISDQKSKKVLLTKEFRKELDDWDYRLPGGKVFDTLDEYESFRESRQDILVAARSKAIEESLQETGIEVSELKQFKKSTLGATVEWDLFVFEVTQWQHSTIGQQLEEGEDIDADGWFSYEEVINMILNGDLKEERIALILLQWISAQNEGDK